MASYLFGPTFFNSVLKNNYKDDFVYCSLKNNIGFEKFVSTDSDTNKMIREKYFLSLLQEILECHFIHLLLFHY